MISLILQTIPLWKVLFYLIPIDLNIFLNIDNSIIYKSMILCIKEVCNHNNTIIKYLLPICKYLYLTYDNPENMPPVDEEEEALKNQPPVVQRVEWLWFGIFFYICIAVIIDHIFPWSNFNDKNDDNAPSNNTQKK